MKNASFLSRHLAAALLYLQCTRLGLKPLINLPNEYFPAVAEITARAKTNTGTSGFKYEICYANIDDPDKHNVLWIVSRASSNC